MATRHRKDASFSAAYAALSPVIQELAKKNFELLKRNPKHPSLHFKCIHRELWSIRIGRNFRALAIKIEGGYNWFWIGTHGDYDRLIG